MLSAQRIEATKPVAIDQQRKSDRLTLEAGAASGRPGVDRESVVRH
jgi:hypothetical protein